MHSNWLETGTGIAMLREESRQVAPVMDGIFGDQFLQIGSWGAPDLFRRHARTQRYAIVACRRESGVDLVTDPEDLAIASDSIDAVLLPHLLETTNDPHAVLREVDRILRPDGALIIAGFNPWGWWGLRHYLSRGRFPAGGQRMISEYRLRDWLNLLDFNVDPARFHHLAAPVYRPARAVAPAEDAEPRDDRRHAMPVASYRRWNPLASCYILVARREVFTVTRIRPAFRRRAQLVGSLVNPSTRNAA